MTRVYGAPFGKVPEWLLDTDVSDRAVRLFAVLDRYADTDGRAFPGRPKLAERLRCGVSSLDRALAELVACSAVLTQPHYRADGSRAANSYWLWPAHPPVKGGTPTGDQGVAPPVGRPLPTQRAAGSTESQGTDTQEDPTTRAEVLFDAFWQAYPRRTAKADARKAWAKACTKADPDAIVEGARRYAADPNLPPAEYVPHPATWLNGERWADGPLPARTNGRPAARPALARKPVMANTAEAGSRVLTDAELWED